MGASISRDEREPLLGGSSVAG
ncbi:hypothetical protein CSHISOI_00159 [Colletotrichum shisoi]|uniref:Uncharacterized protein n=1 Tax=Colletotrichum shisoi TaxID=2078593 RepID=A0A5Q4C7D6_9PEZI|nr:hypothetical protein CSHISOI_00159 [Colletotrichum shisoi]